MVSNSMCFTMLRPIKADVLTYHVKPYLFLSLDIWGFDCDPQIPTNYDGVPHQTITNAQSYLTPRGAAMKDSVYLVRVRLDSDSALLVQPPFNKCSLLLWTCGVYQCQCDHGEHFIAHFHSTESAHLMTTE